MNKLGFKLGIKEIFAVLTLVLLVGFAVKNWDQIITLASQKEEFERWIKSFGSWGYLVFILIQILQVVVFVIPGEVVYFVGGYLYGTFLSSVLSIVGITVGSLICFLLARILGQPFIERIISKSEMNKLKALINTPKASITLFLIYLIPGLPGKDALAYIAGLTPMRFLNFFTITLVARSPWIIISSFWGANLERGNNTALIIVTVLIALILIIGIWKGDGIIKYFSGQKLPPKSK